MLVGCGGWRLRDKEVDGVRQVYELDARGADGRGRMGGETLIEQERMCRQSSIVQGGLVWLRGCVIVVGEMS